MLSDSFALSSELWSQTFLIEKVPVRRTKFVIALLYANSVRLTFSN